MLLTAYQIRLYAPDGFPGVDGVNDWQENYSEVHVQNGRWYPSSMILPNGSIFVVGGQSGSGGPALPTLELLPVVGPPITLDFLQRTNPYNLYPFLTALPSGGIMITYFNEVRVLSEVDFSVTRVLPNAPGNVNSFLSGRTYPFQGVQILMPQYAPYTDPLTVTLCGGSVAGNGIATDNCVSIQPEVPGSQWQLERMPSQRVMPCMAALPDGTYLIVNGAQKGAAGFGLANNPNYNAILYDPSKPFNSRFTVMANTTVARMYHSEALLMDDGRVLISGSDPQDTKFPEEYRVEAFTPPYLLKGLPRPSFEHADATKAKNVTYSGTFDINVNIPSGNLGNVKISLMGAVSSTHGNSFGARTLFPAFTCAGTTCTITAPPNAHVCPPGWFQVFVLDGRRLPSLNGSELVVTRLSLEIGHLSLTSISQACKGEQNHVTKRGCLIEFFSFVTNWDDTLFRRI